MSRYSPVHVFFLTSTILHTLAAFFCLHTKAAHDIKLPFLFLVKHCANRCLNDVQDIYIFYTQ